MLELLPPILGFPVMPNIHSTSPRENKNPQSAIGADTRRRCVICTRTGAGATADLRDGTCGVVEQDQRGLVS